MTPDAIRARSLGVLLDEAIACPGEDARTIAELRRQIDVLVDDRNEWRHKATARLGAITDGEVVLFSEDYVECLRRRMWRAERNNAHLIVFAGVAITALMADVAWRLWR